MQNCERIMNNRAFFCCLIIRNDFNIQASLFKPGDEELGTSMSSVKHNQSFWRCRTNARHTHHDAHHANRLRHPEKQHNRTSFQNKRTVRLLLGEPADGMGEPSVGGGIPPIGGGGGTPTSGGGGTPTGGGGGIPMRGGGGGGTPPRKDGTDPNEGVSDVSGSTSSRSVTSEKSNPSRGIMFWEGGSDQAQHFNLIGLGSTDN